MTAVTIEHDVLVTILEAAKVTLDVDRHPFDQGKLSAAIDRTGRLLRYTNHTPMKAWEVRDAVERTAREVVEWHDHEWPSPDGTAAELPRIAMKFTEEWGELNGALVKHIQGRTDKDWLAEAHKEFGDVIVCLMVLHSRMRWLEEERAQLHAGMAYQLWERFMDRWDGPPGTANAGVKHRRGASYRV